MARPSTIPGPKKANPASLYRIAVPGGSATFWKKEELPPRKSREVNILSTILAPTFKKIAAIDMASAEAEQSEASAEIGSQIIGDSGLTLDEGLSLTSRLDREETRLLFELNDVVAWAYLKDWTVKVGSERRPLPETAEDFLDLPTPLYEAISKHAAKLYNLKTDDKFSVDAVEDPNSPTGASGA